MAIGSSSADRFASLTVVQCVATGGAVETDKLRLGSNNGISLVDAARWLVSD